MCIFIITFCRFRSWSDQALHALAPPDFRNSVGAVFLLFCGLWLSVLFCTWLFDQELEKDNFCLNKNFVDSKHVTKKEKKKEKK